MCFYAKIVHIYVFILFFTAILTQEISFDDTKVVQETDARFLNVAIDSGVIRRHWEKFEPRSSKVKALASALQPCYLRMGGTDADFLIFDNENTNFNTKSLHLHMPSSEANHMILKELKKPSGGRKDNIVSAYGDSVKGGWDVNNSSYRYSQIKGIGRHRRDVGYYGDVNKDLTNYTMSAAMYDDIHRFVTSVGWDLIFDLNVLLRKDGHWDPDNAVQLLNYTVAKGYKMAGWELGNEPNAFYHLIKFRLEAETLAGDYKILKQKLDGYKSFDRGVILGPSVTQLNKKHTDKYFQSFLNSGGGSVVTAASFHQYYINGRTATIDQFVDPDILNFLHTEVTLGVELTKASGSKARVWLGETSSAWGGGAPGLSDRYVASFMWLDKLGMSARLGVDVVIRQSFYGGHYALLDTQTLDPNPDYWLSLLYKILVGSRVLDVTSPDSMGTLRVYAHCTATTRSGYTPGSVIVYVLNLANTDVNVTFAAFPANTPLHIYSMQPVGGDLKSQLVALNGQTLVVENDKLPNLLIPIKSSGHPVNIPALTYSFIVLPDISIQICK